jgi:hypothetical protein
MNTVMMYEDQSHVHDEWPHSETHRNNHEYCKVRAGSRSVCIVRSRTQTVMFSLV